MSRSRIIILVITLAALFLACAILFRDSKARTGGRFAYPLDDTYIGMAVAKSFSQHGVWGVTRHEFSSTTSSPLFTLLIAIAYFFGGPNEWTPLVLCAIFAFLAVAAINVYLEEIPLWASALALPLIVSLAALPIMTLTGMEHCTHIFLALCFVRLASRILESGRYDWRLPWLAAALVLVRYESLFPVFIVAALLLFQRRWRYCLGLLASAGAAVCAYGISSVIHGGSWLPNSVLLKGSPPVTPHSAIQFAWLLGLRAVWGLVREPHMLALVLLLISAWFAISRSSHLWDRRRISLAICFLAVVAHMQYANVGWPYRYEAYLLAIGLASSVASIPLMKIWRAPSLVFAASSVCALLVMIPKIVIATRDVPERSFEIYEQQGQMASFLTRYYPTGHVAANDIGWISYATDIQLLDLVGLGSNSIFQAKNSNRYHTSTIQSEAERSGTDMAIVYDAWFCDRWRYVAAGCGGPPLPSEWRRVAQWLVPDGHNLGDKTVSFYSVNAGSTDKLAHNLEEFEHFLPLSVKVVREYAQLRQ